MRQFFGIDIGGTAVKWAIFDEGFSILDRGKVPTSFSSAEELVQALVGLVEPYRDAVCALGVSVPGSVMEGDEDGVIHRGGALTYMDQFPLARALRERLGLPVAVNNDGKCCALGEYAAGALKGTRFGVVIAVGTGLGGGIVIDGRVLRGAHCFAGEFSFLNNNAAEPVSWRTIFGSTGGWKALRARVLAEKGMDAATDVDGRTIFSWIEAGDKAARRGLDAYALAFDNWLVNLQAVLDPEVFAIAGGISANPLLVEAMEAQMDAAVAGYAGPLAGFPRPRVVRAQLGNDANLYGAVQECVRLA